MSLQLHAFQFNPFQENTYVLYNEENEAVVIDPGCFETYEQQELTEFITQRDLKVQGIWLTHAHIDHVLGIPFVQKQYQCSVHLHEGELPLYEKAPQIGDMYGIPCGQLPTPTGFFKEGELLQFGKHTLEVLYTPGHSPASICFYCEKESMLISGDVLFQGSIGRTDLPGGSMEVLMDSIYRQLLVLEDNVEVYSGHGPKTSIGAERKNNPFLQNF